MSQTPAPVLEPIDRDRLVALAEKGKANPGAVRTLKVRTVLEKKFRHLNYVRDLPPHVIDEPPGLLGDDTAPNPSEAVLAALGSCISVGIHANAVLNRIHLTRLELELEADINITAVWGTGDLSEDKLVGFSAIRVRARVEGDAPRERLDALIAHADRWSPVANTLRLPVPISVKPA
ncbi:MAG: OsmC family protein [Opitutaceae bacterium]|jgi:uncharacterized OsmC-like protein